MTFIERLFLEARVNEFLEGVYARKGPFTKYQLQWGEEVVLRWMAAHEEVPKDARYDSYALAASGAADAELQKKQTQGDQPPSVVWLTVSGGKLAVVADNQEVYVYVENAGDEELRELVLREEGKERAFALSLSEHHTFYLIENITPKEMQDFISLLKKSPKTHDMTWS